MASLGTGHANCSGGAWQIVPRATAHSWKNTFGATRTFPAQTGRSSVTEGAWYTYALTAPFSERGETEGVDTHNFREEATYGGLKNCSALSWRSVWDRSRSWRRRESLLVKFFGFCVHRLLHEPPCLTRPGILKGGRGKDACCSSTRQSLFALLGKPGWRRYDRSNQWEASRPPVITEAYTVTQIVTE